MSPKSPRSTGLHRSLSRPTGAGLRQVLGAPLLGAVVGAGLVLGCAHRPTQSLRMSGNVGDASVLIDDEYVGPLSVVAKRGVALPPGPHQITVRKFGFFPHDVLVDADPEQEEPIVLKVELRPIPD